MAWINRTRSSEESLAVAIARLRPKTVRLARSILGGEEAAQDVAQEVAVRALRFWQSDDMGGFEAWVRRVAVRCAVTMLAERRQATLEEDAFARDENLPLRLAVDAVLDRLTPEQRALLGLALGEQWSYAEIAEALEIPVGTVASRLHTAKLAFKKQWGEP